MTWIVVQSFSFPYEAHIAKTQLEAAGIPARIENEHTINMDWLYSNALGGVRVLVLESNLEEARALLAQDFSQELQEQFGLSENCPNCGSSDIQPYTEGKRPAYLVFYCLVFHYFFIKME
jgi:hypothetical protein